jgi:hypothetical protein
MDILPAGADAPTLRCPKKRGHSSQLSNSGSPDPGNQPPQLEAQVRTNLDYERCILGFAAHNPSAFTRDPEGEAVTISWKVDGQVVHQAGPAAPRTEEEALRAFGPAKTLDFGTSRRQHTVELIATDARGAWSSRSFSFTVNPTRIRLSRWPCRTCD